MLKPKLTKTSAQQELALSERLEAMSLTLKKQAESLEMVSQALKRQAHFKTTNLQTILEGSDEEQDDIPSPIERTAQEKARELAARLEARITKQKERRGIPHVRFKAIEELKGQSHDLDDDSDRRSPVSPHSPTSSGKLPRRFTS